MRHTLPEKRQATGERAQPNSALWVCYNNMSIRNLRLGEFLAHLEIVDADESSFLSAFAFRPNISVDIFCDTDYQTQWVMIRSRDTPEDAIFVDEKLVVNANPKVACVLRGHVKTGQRWSGQNRPTEVAGD